MSIPEAVRHDVPYAPAFARPNRGNPGRDTRAGLRHNGSGDEQRRVAAIAMQVAAECEELTQLARALATDRATKDADLTEMREQCVAAIRTAEAHAAAAMHAARETIEQGRADAKAQVDELREELARERTIADEATRWASRVERELLLAERPATDPRQVSGAEPAAIEPAGRRSPRVRVRLAS
jgi:hypothetical protein